MQAYDKYKDSGIEWLGEIPEHWEVKKLKHFGYIYPGLSGKKGDDFSKHQFPGGKKYIPFTTISNQFQITKSNFPYVRVDEREFQHQVQKNDLLFLMSSETIEDIGKSSVFLLEERPYLNSFCKGFRIELLNLNSIFSNYLLNSRTYRKYFELYGRGFTRINIKQEFISGIPFGLPPLPEQQAIAAFLDDKCGKIDEAVRIKQQQIEKLKELRQITIHNAVTKGINAEAEMKDSGIDWIGKIPKHWEVKRLKYVFQKILTGTTPHTSNEGYFNGDVDWYNPKDLNNEVLLKADKKVTFKAIEDNQVKLFEKDSILVVGIGATAGKTSYLTNDATFNQQITGFKSTRENNKFYFHTLRSLSNVFLALAQFTTLPILNNEFFKNVLLPHPPLTEQKQIVSYLEAQTSKIDKAIALKTEQIAKLNEYKQSLINDVVTGKIKVTN
jgi:Restriction endonuclease S subunits